jgi:hypothetical protein
LSFVAGLFFGFTKHKNQVQGSKHMSCLAGTARAFATYSLVPYLGIIFCPGAVVLGTVGVIKSYRSHEVGKEPARSVCYVSTIVGLVILAIQLVLWWMLYQAPSWAKFV